MSNNKILKYKISISKYENLGFEISKIPKIRKSSERILLPYTLLNTENSIYGHDNTQRDTS